jgi:hypothetical protein
LESATNEIKEVFGFGFGFGFVPTHNRDGLIPTVSDPVAEAI